MKVFLTSLILLAVFQLSINAQTKVSDVERPIGEIVTSKLDELFIEMDKDFESKGLVIVYSGVKRERIGNTTAVIEGVKAHESFRTEGRLINRISVIIVKGKNPLQQEYWLIKKGEEFPEFEEVDLNFSNLTDKFLFATKCIDCDTDYPRLSGEAIDYDLLTDILRKNSNYNLLIVINGDSGWGEDGALVGPKKYYKNLRNHFSKKYKLEKNRFKFKHIKPTEKIGVTIVRVYIVPENK